MLHHRAFAITRIVTLSLAFVAVPGFITDRIRQAVIQTYVACETWATIIPRYIRSTPSGGVIRKRTGGCLVYSRTIPIVTAFLFAAITMVTTGLRRRAI